MNGATWFAGALCVMLPFAGMLYEHRAERREADELPLVGHRVDVGGRRMNISCIGAGSPTVVFESNWGSPGFRWTYLQRAVSSFTRACWYDRAGLGWSDPGPFPNHSDSIARDLHRLLTNAGERPPYVLVAHAMGAFHARVFRGYYPREVAGAVFVDPMSEDLTIHIHNHIETFRRVVLALRRSLNALGISRLMHRGSPSPPDPGWSAEDWSTLLGLRRQIKARVAAGQEPPLWISGELARAAGGLGDLPIVVLTAGVQDQEEDPKLDHDHALKVALHEKLARLSTHGRHVIVAGSGHDIPDEAPAAVVDAIRVVVTDTRKQSIPHVTTDVDVLSGQHDVEQFAFDARGSPVLRYGTSRCKRGVSHSTGKGQWTSPSRRAPPSSSARRVRCARCCTIWMRHG